MEQKDTSAADGITDGLKIISYVANNKGSQELVSGSMWDPVAIFNRQAWQVIEKQIEASKEKVASGRVSCLHYYMTANQMDTALLAKYTGQSRWLVRLHMVPFFFSRLRVGILEKYIEVFKISLNDLSPSTLKQTVYNQRESDV
jgi:hypothetical protein